MFSISDDASLGSSTVSCALAGLTATGDSRPGSNRPITRTKASGCRYAKDKRSRRLGLVERTSSDKDHVQPWR